MLGFCIIARVFLNSSVVITSEIVVVYLFFFLASSIELKTENETSESKLEALLIIKTCKMIYLKV